MGEDCEYYPPWAWQPIENMPDGCQDVTVRFEDGTTTEYCSCDYWWARYDEPPIHFRYT